MVFVGNRPIRVLIVDDTRSIRAMIKMLLSRSPDILVVGEAGDPYEAHEMIQALKPDVLTLDIILPGMDGLSFLAKLMRHRPMPVVMISTRTKEKSHEAVRALELGAVDCVDLTAFSDFKSDPVNLADVIRVAASSQPLLRHRPNSPAPNPSRFSSFQWGEQIVLIGSSTGGVDALMTILSALPENAPPIVVAQHMPASFLESFASRLDRNCAVNVCIAEGRQLLEPGNVYFGPGGTDHILLSNRTPNNLCLQKDLGDQSYIPSVDLLFSSAEKYAKNIVAILLSGMGRDGADAMLRLKQAGAQTIAQSGDTAVVDGMPKSAREIGAACEVVPLGNIARKLLSKSSSKAPASAG